MNLSEKEDNEDKLLENINLNSENDLFNKVNEEINNIGKHLIFYNEKMNISCITDINKSFIEKIKNKEYAENKIKEKYFYRCPYFCSCISNNHFFCCTCNKNYYCGCCKERIKYCSCCCIRRVFKNEKDYIKKRLAEIEKNEEDNIMKNLDKIMEKN